MPEVQSVTAKSLREERGKLAAEIKALADKANDEKRDFKAEEKANWDKVNADYNALTASIERQERLETIAKDQEGPQDGGRQLPGRHDVDHSEDADDGYGEEARSNPKPRITEEHRCLALQAWCNRQLDEDWKPTKQHREACELIGIRPSSRTFRIKLTRDYAKVRTENRDLSILNPTAGAFTIAEGFVPRVERAMLAFGGVRQVATVMRTDKGEDLHWPTTNDTSNTGALIQENTAVTELDPTFAEIVFRAYKYTSRLVQVPVELLQDSAFDLASVLGDMLGERLGRIQNTHFTTGDNAAKPQGIVPSAAAGITAASATAIAADEIIRLVHTIDPAYRVGPGVGFMMHDGILSYTRRLKDGNGQYIWMAGLQAGIPDRLYGYTIVVNQDMQATVASNTKTIIFGNLAKYHIRDVGEIRLRRLVERYAEADQEGFVAFYRCDGRLLDAGVAPIKVLLQAT